MVIENLDRKSLLEAYQRFCLGALEKGYTLENPQPLHYAGLDRSVHEATFVTSKQGISGEDFSWNREILLRTKNELAEMAMAAINQRGIVFGMYHFHTMDGIMIPVGMRSLASAFQSTVQVFNDVQNPNKWIVDFCSEDRKMNGREGLACTKCGI